MLCDNTSCKGRSKKFYDIILTKDFNNDKCVWCEDCLDIDNDMVLKAKLKEVV